MRTPVSQRSRRVPPKRHFSPLDSYKSVREIKNLAWEFSPFEMSHLIKVRENAVGGASPSNWKSTQHFNCSFHPLNSFFDASLFLCDPPRLRD